MKLTISPVIANIGIVSPSQICHKLPLKDLPRDCFAKYEHCMVVKVQDALVVEIDLARVFVKHHILEHRAETDGLEDLRLA